MNFIASFRSFAAFAVLGVAVSFIGCAAKAPMAARVAINLDDSIYEPGERAVLTVAVSNPGAAALAVGIPTPTNTRVYLSRLDEAGKPLPQGRLEVAEDLSGSGSVDVPAGETYQATLVVPAMPATEGRYSIIATYSNEAAADPKPSASDDIEFLVE